MNSPIFYQAFQRLAVAVLFLLAAMMLPAQTTRTIAAGSYIIDMGVSPQTVNNALKPYGMVYDLLGRKTRIIWSINPAKGKDGVDFTVDNISFKGGPFVIEAEFRTAEVNSRITFWESQGVVGHTTTSSVTIPVYTDKLVQPSWTMDKDNGDIALSFFTNAAIPSTAHGGSSDNNWPFPSQLDCCDQIFVMPHADPEWDTHQRLFTWNEECEGSIWLGCHAGSALENMFNPSIPSQQTNFLAQKNQVASGGGPYFENALILWDNHDDGTPPYSYDHHAEPEMQFLGTIDAATQNGSEQIYIPLSEGWWPSTKVGVYDPDHPERYTPYDDAKHRAAVLAFGPGMGDPDRGAVMLEASHNIAGTTAARVAAQRAFFNFSLHALAERAVFPSMVLPSGPLDSGNPYTFEFTLPAGVDPAEYTATWSSSCGGTFTPVPGSPLSITFTPPVALSPQSCIITVSIANACGHTSFSSEVRTVQCNLQVTPTVVDPCFNDPTGGSISMAITNGPAPYVWNWTRTGGGSGSGSGTTISGLSAGTYSVTVTADNGAGCPETFQATVTTLPEIVLEGTITYLDCTGDGAVDLTVTGGNAPLDFAWEGPNMFAATTKDISGLEVGIYSVTVTDDLSCTADQSFSVQKHCIAMIKEPVPAPTYEKGDEVTYIFTIKNLGSTELTNVTVTDPLPGLVLSGNPIASLAAGATDNSITGTYTITEDDRDAGEVVNQASVTGTPPAGPPPSDDSDDDSFEENDPTVIPVVQFSDLSLSKSASDLSPEVGDVVTFTVTVSNAGPEKATGVAVEDVLPNGYGSVTGINQGGSFSGGVITWTDRSIAAGTDLVLTYQATVLEPGPGVSYTNTAQVTASDLDDSDSTPNNDDPTEDDQDEVTLTPVFLPSWTLTKTSSTSPNSFDAPGDVLTYDLLLENTGLLSISAVNVSDPGADAVPGIVRGADQVGDDDNILAPGEIWTYTAQYTVTQSDVDAGSYTNTATATGTPTGGTLPDATDSETVSGEQNPGLLVTKTVTASEEYEEGDVIAYEILVENTGNVTLTAPTVSDPQADAPGPQYVSGDADTDNLLDVGETWTFEAFHTAVEADMAAGSFTNTATATSDDPNGDPVSDDDDATATAIRADLAVTKTATPDPVTAGTSLTYTITVTNNGPYDAENVELEDILGTGQTITGALPSSGSWTAPFWTIGNLSVGQSEELELTVLVDDDLAEGSQVQNRAVVTSDTYDPDDTNNEDEVNPAVETEADLRITKVQIDPTALPAIVVVDPSVATPGEKLYYQLVVVNDGPSDAQQVLIEDMLPAGLSGAQRSFNFGSSWQTWTGSHTVISLANGASFQLLIRADIDPAQTGTLTNTAEVSSDTPDPDPSDNSSTEETQLDPMADLVITKEEINAPIQEGGEIVYRIHVQNVGPSDATNVIVTDALPGTIFLSPEYSTDNGSTWPNAWTGSLNIGTVAVGADYEFLIRAMLVDNNPDPNVNPVPNTASVESEDVDDPDPSNNMDMIETPLEEIADLAIVKAGPTSVTPGTEIEYTITVTNTGSTFTAASVNMVDVLDPSLVADPEYSLDGGMNWLPFTSPLDLGNMAPQEVIVVLLRGDVPSDVMSAIPNTAEVFSGTPDNDPTDNSSTISTPIQKVADLSIVKLQIDPSILPLSPVSLPADLSTLSIDPMQIGVGEDIYYLLVYMNHGPSDATNVIVTDNLPVEILNPEAQYCGQGGYAPWTGSYNAGTVVAGGRCIIVLRGEIAAGSYQDLTNTATVGSMDVTDSDPTNNSSTIVTELVLNPAITVTKSSSWKKFSQIGAVIPYTIAVENTGDAALTSVTLSDPLADAGSIAYQSGDTDMDNLLDPGETWTYTATHTVVAADRTVGSVVNVATVDAEDLRGDPIEEDSNPVTVEALFADDDQYTTPYETAVSASVAPNDTYPTGSTFDDSAGPLHGMLTFNSDGSFTYTPDAGFTGLDTFTYVVCLPAPNGMQCDTAIAVIVVGPDAVNDVFITPFDTDLFGQTDTNDVFVPGSSFELVSDVSHGILLFHGDGSFDYDPDFGFTGPDTFFYRICMPAPNGSLCDTAMVRILVSPQAVDDDLVLTPYETFIPGYDVGLNDFFPPGAQFATVTDPTLGTLNFGSNGNFTYQPAQQFSGLVPFTYQVFYNPADTANVLIVVGPKSNDNAYVTPYETPFTATVVPNDTFMAGSGFTVLDLVDHGTLSFMNDGSFSYTPDNGYSGTDTFTYEVCLPAPWNVLCDTAIAVILIAPNAVDDDYTTPYQTPVPGSAGDNDTYPTGATFMALDTPPNGSLTFQTDGSFLYTPDNGFAGLDSFPYKVCLPAPNGTVCDTAFVRIQVDNAVILAVDDTYGPVTGSIGDPNLGNVLDNDQVNFLPTDITEVSIGIVTPATPLLPGTTVPVVNTATGTVSVPSGTPAGVYSITYRICEITYPFNCDTAIATVTVVEFPGMGVAKRIIAGPTNNNDGTYDLTYEILVENTGDVRLTQVQVTEELEQTFADADAFAVVSLTSADFQVNAGFNGATDSFLLAGTDTLLVGESALIALIVQVTPGGNLGPYENLVTGSGRSPVNVPTEDDSQDGDDPDPDNDDDPGNNSDPTPVTFDCPLSLVNVPADLTVACDSLSQIIDNVQPSTPGCCLPITLDKDTLFTAGNCPGNYSLTFTWTATDDCGQMATATQVVTVRDTQAPTWDQAMPANVTVECDAVPAVASPIDASDNCDANATVTYTEVRTDGSCPENYTLTRTWTATDDCGNAVTHTQQIEVRDTQVPLWDVPLPANLTVECHDIPTPLTFTATDICDSAPTIEFTESQTPGSCPGNYTIFRTWKATDNCGNMSVRTRQLTVIDTLAPYWAQPMPADITVECDSVPAAASPIAALDSCDAGVSVTFAQTLVPGNCLNNYTLLRTWTATDDCGNSTTHTQEVTVRDTESPAWSDPMPQDLMVACDSVPVASTSYPAEDNCDTDVQVSYNETRTDGNCPDNYTLTRTWTAEDNCGNRTTHTQTIEVTDQLAPTWSQPMPADTLVGCDAVPPAFSPVNADDLCSDVTVSYLETRTDGNCAHNYMLLRTWTATDACGNASTFTQHISVTDTVAPVLMGLPADTVYVQCTEDLPVPATLTATDNCSSDVDIQLSESGDPMACINHFGLVRTWTATDACGNATTFVQCLMAMDTTAPVLQNLPPASVLLNCAEDVPAAAAVTATDNCVAPVRIDFAETLTPGDCDNRFTVTRTWVATDTCDNSSVFVQVITVNDTIAPEWAQPMSLPVGITVECDMVPTAAMPTATDNCASGAVVTMSETRMDGSCPDNYTLTRTWTATDDCGNTTTHVQQILVRDTQVPLWDTILPLNETVACHELQAPHPFTASDNCDANVTVTISEESEPGSCPDSYTLTRTWTATDNCGNMNSHVQQVTVIDTLAPYWAQPMPADITVECDSVPAAASPIAALDSCDAGVSVTFAQTLLPGNCLNNYTLLRTWTATDDCGNSTTHTQEVTVRDTESPEWSDPMPQDLMVECDSVPVASTSYPATDNCDTDVQVSYQETRTDGNCTDNYTLTRTWTAEDNCGNRTTHTQTIQVGDVLPPTWSQPMPADTLVGCDAVPPAFSPVNADDLCSDVTVSYLETRTDGNCAHNYMLTRTWTATDACGNATVHTQSVSVTDTVAPVLQGLPDPLVQVSCTDEVPVPAPVSATDNCTVPVAVTLQTDSIAGGCANRYTLVRTWTATDSCGNESAFTQTVMVYDSVAPMLQGLPDPLVQVSCTEEVSVPATVTATDNCSGGAIVTLQTDSIPEGCANRYTLLRTWTATDVCGNTSAFTQTVMVYDSVAPLLQGLPPATLNLACAESVPTPAMVTATDNCASTPSVQFSEDLQPGNCPNRYTLLRTWTATDACGNSSSFVQTITVSDSIAPIWNQAMPGNVTVECSAVPAVPAVTASDNCSTGAAVNYNQVRTNGNCTDAYILTRTWTATDPCGNAITHTQTIDVRDTTAPTWNQAMPGNVTVECDAVTAPLTPVAASDNCDTQVTVSFATVRIDGNCPGNYTLTRSWTATDNCGNALTHVQVLTVRDTQAPVLSCQDITVELNANGQVLITPAQVTATASDNCGTVSLSLDQTGFDCSEIGDVTVNLTATDDCGNTSSCQSRVTVQDNMPPQISGPATYTVNLDPGLCCQVVNWPLPTVTDNCPLAADALVQTAGPLNGTELCKDDSPWSVTYEVTDANGNNASFSFTVEMFEYQNPDKALACNDLVQISLDEDCDTEVKADMILEGGTYGCYDDYEVTILTALNEPLASSPFVGRAQIGKMWTVRLTDPETGNMCWGKILVEDKMKPVLVCRDTVIDCGAVVPDHPGYPVQDNCTPFDLMNQVGKHLQFADLTDHFDCAQNADLWKRITRVWTAVDESGNSSVCTQRIDLRRPTLATVTLPRNYDDKDLPSLDCQSGYPLPALTGEPLGCNSIAASYVDEVLTVCPGSYTVVRQWTLLEMCTANTGTHTQVIHVLDKTAPQVFCPDPHDIHVGGTKKISAKDCRAEVALPWIAVTDDCSTVNEMTVYARTTLPDGSEIIVNQPSAGGKFLFDVPVGFDYTFSYVAIDACGNKAECSVQVSVQDVTPPVAVCETFHVVALTDSITWVNASSFDDGSNDACTMVSFAARRMPHSCNLPGDDVFRNKVPFYCCDGLSQEPLMVELRVRDGWGNDNFCMVSVTVVDLVKPVIWCPKDITVQCGMPYEPTDPDTLTVSAEPGMVIQGAYPYTYNVPLQVDGLPADAQVTDIDLGLHISHEAVEQLRITLVGPQGQKAVVLNPGGCGNMPPPFPADISVTFNDEGAPFQCSMAAPSIGSISGQMRPQGDVLDVFDGTHPNGGWTLVIEDTAPLGQGLIHGVTLHIGHQRPLAWKPLVTDNTEECGLQIGYTDLGSPDNCPDGSYISRRWRVTDAYGNSSACVQKVWFEDYTPLIVQFPCDVTAGCGSTPSDTGEPVHNGDCEVPGIGFEDKTLAATDACLIIERTWTVHDWCRYQPDGNIDYLLSNVNPAQEEITFNSSINPLLTNRKVQIGDRLTLRYLTSGTAEIPGMQEGDIYSLVRVSGTTFRVDWNSTQQKTVDITGMGTGPHIFRYANSERGLPRACSELQANYPFTQWVQGCCTGTQQRAWEDDGDGYFRFVQEIRIVDQVAPQFTDCTDTETCSFQDDCGPAPVQLFGWATDECTPTDQLAYTWSIDLYGDGNEDLTGSGADASGDYPLGKHLITFKVNDQCGNWNICTKSFTVKDCKKPQPVCINGISVDLMATPNGGMALLAATALEAGGSTDNCTPYGKLKFLVERLSDLGTGQNAPDAHATPELQVTCDDIPPKASEPVVKVILWVGDEAGNWDYCETFVWVQDNMGACGIGSATLTAKVLNEEKEPVEQVIVELAGNSVQKLVTGSDGTVTFGGLQTGQSVTLTPAKDMFPLNGVSTYDLLLMQKHLLGVKALNSPYKLIAADVNKNCALSVSDIIELRRMILTPGLDFKDNTSWRFVDGTFTFPNPGAPCGFPETRSIPALAAQQTVSFVGVKVGDVSGDALPNSLLGSETRSAVGTLSFALPEVALEAGREYVVPVRAEDYRAVQGYQYTLGFDTDVLEFVQVQGVWSDLGQSNFGTTKAGEGLIATSWNSSEPVDLTDGEVLYTLTFRARANGRLSQALRVNSRIAQAEAYNAEEEPLDVALHFDGVKAAGGFALYQNEPNPFGEMTTIGFELPAASQATLTVYDVTGKVLKVIAGQYARGYHKVVLLRSELQAQGMLYYRLDTDTDSATKRMILAD